MPRAARQQSAAQLFFGIVRIFRPVALRPGSSEPDNHETRTEAICFISTRLMYTARLAEAPGARGHVDSESDPSNHV
jgi:hypothetical protein